MKHFVNIKLDKGAKAPYKKHITDAGYDLYANSNPEIVSSQMVSPQMKRYGEYFSIDYIQYRTGVYIQPQDTEHIVRFDLRSRSSISKYWLSLCNAPATIDHDYTGEILIRFNYLFQPLDIEDGVIRVNQSKIYQKGDRICQLLPSFVDTLDINIVDKLNRTERSDKGFGEGTGK